MTRKYPSRFQRRTLWNALTGVAILTIGLLIASMIWLLGQVLGFLQPVLVPLAVAGITAYLLDPVVSWLQRKGLSRLKSVAAVFAGFLVVIALMAWMVIPPIVKQLSDTERLSKLGENVYSKLVEVREQPWVAYLLEPRETSNADASESVEGGRNPEKLKQDTFGASSGDGDESEASADTAVAKVPFEKTRLAGYLPEDMGEKGVSLLKGGTSKIVSILGLMLGFAMAPIYLYYFLKESSGIKAHWHDYVPLKASRFKTEVVETLQEINGYLISFFRGQVLVAFIDGILVGLALWIFGLPYGLVIGVFMAVIGVIPYIGNILCLIPACIIAFVHFGDPAHQNFIGTNPWLYVAAVIAIFFIVQQINSLLTAPKIVGDSVGLHPMTVIFSMLFWSLILGGFIGALLAVPLTAAVKVLFRRYIWERKLNEPPVEVSDTPSNEQTATEPA